MLVPMNQAKLSTARDLQDLSHQAYLLRLWRAAPDQPAAWRASLENTRTGERFGFALLEQLFVFLMEQAEHADRTIPSSDAQHSTANEK